MVRWVGLGFTHESDADSAGQLESLPRSTREEIRRHITHVRHGNGNEEGGGGGGREKGRTERGREREREESVFFGCTLSISNVESDRSNKSLNIRYIFRIRGTNEHDR